MINPATRRSAPDADSTPRPAARRRPVEWLAWAVPAAATAALGLCQIGTPMLWRDELATWSAASRNFPQLWTMTQHIDAVLGPYYFGLHLWMAVFGDSAVAMRVPSVIAMTGTAAVAGLIGRRLGGVSAGLAGGLVFALIPSVSRYAQEARPYAFATLFAALATLLLLRAVERPSGRRWGGYALALAAAGACNLVALCVLAGHAVAVLAACWQRTERAGGGAFTVRVRSALAEGETLAILAGCGVSAIVAVLLDAPIIITGHAQSLSQIGRQPTPSLADLAGASGLWSQLFYSTPVAIAVIVLAVASAAIAPRRAASWCGLAFAVMPIAAIWLISQGSASYWVVRYLLFTVPAWAVAAGLGIDGIGQRVPSPRLARLHSVLQPRYAIAAGLTVAVGLLGLHDQWAMRQYQAHNAWAYPRVVPNGEPVDYPGASAVIAAHERPGDGIVFQVSDHNHYQVDTSVGYYLRGKPMPDPVFQAKTQAQAGSLQPVGCADPARCLAGTPRLWVVYVNHLVQGSSQDPFLAIPPDEAAVLRAAGYRTQARYQEEGITVALMVSR